MVPSSSRVLITSSQLVTAFGITLFAGLATGVGSAIAFFSRRTSFRFLAISLGFSGGVMIYISFVEILAKARDAFATTFGPKEGELIAVGAFLGGVLLMAIVDNLVPAAENPHEPRSAADVNALREPAGDTPHQRRLLRMGLFTAGAILFHNFPEGVVTFLAAIDNVSLGLAIGLAVAIHNIPEGISVSVPIYFATGNRLKAFVFSFLTGLAEPAGALVAFGLLWALGAFQAPAVMGVMFGLVAGTMVYISLDELLPVAREYGKSHEVLFGIAAGMGVMGLSLVLLR
jgi:ZIP family zinc transporter